MLLRLGCVIQSSGISDRSQSRSQRPRSCALLPPRSACAASKLRLDPTCWFEAQHIRSLSLSLSLSAQELLSVDDLDKLAGLRYPMCTSARITPRARPASCRAEVPPARVPSQERECVASSGSQSYDYRRKSERLLDASRRYEHCEVSRIQLDFKVRVSHIRIMDSLSLRMPFQKFQAPESGAVLRVLKRGTPTAGSARTTCSGASSSTPT
jgi:hypothetical protein